MNIENLKNIIINSYSIKIKSIEKNMQSTDGNVYIIESDKNKFVMKIYDDLNHTKSMISLHIHLSDKIYAPKVIINNLEEYYTICYSKYIVLYSFLEGIQINDIFDNISKENIAAIAHTLHKLHNLTSKNIFYLKDVPFSISNNLDRYSVIHFDLTKHNIFINNDKIGFIDFDDAKYGLSVIDIAITLSLLFFSKKRGANISALNIFIKAYYNDNEELKHKEIPYIKEYALKWVDYILGNNNFDSSLKTSFLEKKELIEKYMNF